MVGMDGQNLLNLETADIDDQVDAAAEHAFQCTIRLTVRYRPCQGEDAVEDIRRLLGMSGRDAAVSGKSGAHEFHGLIADNFADAIGIERHGQTV